ncbi:hypothetical protein [Streptomyces sp. NPDC001714]|uniref:hypothetical protein n=1 Tax=Streptomyces sp. NPDC001714 TaxID=3364603 RepID=UPI0036C66E08
MDIHTDNITWTSAAKEIPDESTRWTSPTSGKSYPTRWKVTVWPRRHWGAVDREVVAGHEATEQP